MVASAGRRVAGGGRPDVHGAGRWKQQEIREQPQVRQARAAPARQAGGPSTEEVKPITLKRRLLNTMGFTKTPRERSSSEDSSTKPEPVEAVVVPASDAVEGVVVGDEPPPLTSLEA